MKNIKVALATVLLLSVFGVYSAVKADTVAVVDVKMLANKSAQFQALKKEQQTKIKELDKWLQTVREDVKKQKTQEGKDKLIAKYDAEFLKKREAIVKDYQTKIQKIDKNITDAIVNEAKTKGYDVVLSKQGNVLYSSKDITQDLVKVIK